MYSEIHNSYIIRGVDLCSKLAKVASSNDEVMAVQEELAEYSHSAGTAVAKIVKEVRYPTTSPMSARGRSLNDRIEAIAGAGQSQRAGKEKR